MRFFFHLLSRLPFGLLYLLADLLYLVARYGLRYRQAVIMDNLRRAFPGKDHAWYRQTAGEFYRHLADVIVEILKSMTMSAEAFRQRVHIENPEVLGEHLARGESVLVMTSHYANWEWMLPRAALQYPQATMRPVYQTLSNVAFDQLVKVMRSRFGAEPVVMERTLQALQRNKDKIGVMGLVADQIPGKHALDFWTIFLQQETAFYTGTEKLAYLSQQPVVFADMRRIGRGHYILRFENIGQPPYTKGSRALTIKYIRLLEAQIKRQPADWLWSHKRWKHQRPADQPLSDA